MFIYGVLPGIIICFFYATIKALTQRTPEGIVDIIYILCILIIFPVAYGYFIYRRINAKKDKKCEIRKIELNSHARLACYTMNKTGVASGSFS